MKLALLLVALCLVVALGSAVQITPPKRHPLINRPKIGVFGPRAKRAPGAGVKGRPAGYAPPSLYELNVTKGEYVCGNKICKLEPGVEPEGCNGMCQYPIIPKIN